MGQDGSARPERGAKERLRGIESQSEEPTVGSRARPGSPGGLVCVSEAASALDSSLRVSLRRGIRAMPPGWGFVDPLLPHIYKEGWPGSLGRLGSASGGWSLQVSVSPGGVGSPLCPVPWGRKQIP